MRRVILSEAAARWRSRRIRILAVLACAMPEQRKDKRILRRAALAQDDTDDRYTLTTQIFLDKIYKFC